jgi:CheY-like chemotaxis protein
VSDVVYKILLVEDNAADVYLFRKALERTGLNFELILIEDGGEALAFVRADGKYSNRPVPHLAVLDWNLPRHEGIEVLAAIRAHEALANLPVVITSSSTSPRDPLKTGELRVDRYLRKPPDLESFLEVGTALREVLLAAIKKDK